jgi:hypothetical protein
LKPGVTAIHPVPRCPGAANHHDPVMTFYLPPSSPRPVDRLVTNDMTPRQRAWLGRRDEKEDLTMRTNVQRLGEHVTAALLGQVTP